VLDKAKALLNEYKVPFVEYVHPDSGTHELRVTGGYSETLRVLGMLGTERLNRKLQAEKYYTRAIETPQVLAVEDAGLQEIAVMGTSTRTYFANGYAMHNSNQEATIDLFGEEQRELAVHLLLAALKRWSALFANVVVAAVIGNHGQNRKEKGGTYTDDVRDNTDTAVFKTAALVLNENPDRYGHVSFFLPRDRTTLCLDVAGVPVGVVHGHQFHGGGKLSQAKAVEWWKGQSLGLQPVAHAIILVSAHFHHMSLIEHGPRTHFQTPAMDPGSRWVNEGLGSESPSGTLTFVIQDGGWVDPQIIR
jgi:hypothetical protein